MNNNFKEIEEFFHVISPDILDLVQKNHDKKSITTQKGGTEHSINFATETDVAVERMIIHAITEKFPLDAILAEEENDQTSLKKPGRLWIIDPICGTSNFARGLPLYVSNIALAENGTMIASCVVDHLFGRYFWSVGNGIYDGIKPAHIEKSFHGTIIDIDIGALVSAPQQIKNQYAKFVERMCRETDISLITLNTSLSFLLVAIGIYEGFVSPYAHPWDLAASIFLIQQAGGVVTDVEGRPWTLATPNAVAALNPALYVTLMKYLRNE